MAPDLPSDPTSPRFDAARRPRHDAPRRVAVAGATGFVGRPLVAALAERHQVSALGRRAVDGPDPGEGEPGLRWRRCDLFSMRNTEAALEGVEVAYYLVHSMQPTSRLTQARFSDLDLLLADNFGRAAARAGVKRIVYLGGLVPRDPEALSEHLASRLEVERALGVEGVPVTALRAGLVVGRGGSSLQILVRLVGRLPVMVCPRWTASLSQPIALDDVVTLLLHCLDDEETKGRICEVGGPDVLSYRDMMRATARALHKRRWMIPVPLFTPELSRLWVSLVTQQPRELVAPLVQSLRHPMVAEDRWLQERCGVQGQHFEGALAEAIRAEGLARVPTALSVQRLVLPPDRDASWVAREYAAWLPRAFGPLIDVERDGPVLRFRMLGVPEPLLELTAREERSWPDRALLEITGGSLAGRAIGNPRLEFRTTPDGEHVLAAVQDFHPRLPWRVYVATQARVHLAVMWRFGRHLARVARGAAPAQESPSEKA